MGAPRISDGQPMSKSTIARRKREAGLTRPYRYSFNEELFRYWSDDLAWLLGLIWSDGCLFGNTVEICTADFQLAELVAALLEHENWFQPKNGGRHLRVVFTAKWVADWLRSIGLTEAKSLTIRWPTGLPEAYEGAFMRGILDGDGSVFLHHGRPGQKAPDARVIWYTASDGFKDDIVDWLDGLNIACWCDKSSVGLHRVHVFRQDSIRRLYPVLYKTQSDVCCLHRKHSAYAYWMDHPRYKAGRPRKQRCKQIELPLEEAS